MSAYKLFIVGRLTDKNPTPTIDLPRKFTRHSISIEKYIDVARNVDRVNSATINKVALDLNPLHRSRTNLFPIAL